MSEVFYVYEHMRNDTGEIFYVGKGKNGRAYSSHGRNKYWYRVVKKANGFTVRLLTPLIDEELSFLVEIERINQLKRIGKRLTNLTDGGEGVSGIKKSPELLEKLSKAFLGNQYRKGIPNSPEQRKRHSEAMKGRVFSEEHRKNLSEAQTGKPGKFTGNKHKEATIIKMREKALMRPK